MGSPTLCRAIGRIGLAPLALALVIFPVTPGAASADASALVRTVADAIGPPFPTEGFRYTLASDVNGTRFWVEWQSTLPESSRSDSMQETSPSEEPAGLARGLAGLRSPLARICQALGTSEFSGQDSPRARPVRLETRVQDPDLGSVRAGVLLSRPTGAARACQATWQLEGYLPAHSAPQPTDIVKTASLIRTDR